MKFTKIVAISINASIAVVLLSGCGSNMQPVQTKSEMPPLNGRMEVKEKNKVTGLYYKTPLYAEAVPIVNNESLSIVRNLSSGLVQCNLNDLYLISNDRLERIRIANQQYNSTLTNVELKQLKTYPKSIPKRESKEFVALSNVYTELTRTGHIACIHPISKKELRLQKERRAHIERKRAEQEKRRAEQEKIDKDPRVIAARIQAEAIRESAKMQAEAIKEAAYKERQQQRMQNYSQNIQNIMDKSDRRIQMHQLGYTLTH